MEFLGLEIVLQAAHAAVTLTLAGSVVWLSRRHTQQKQAAETRLAVLENDLKALTSGAVGVGRKLLTVEQRIQETEKRTQELSLSDPVKVSYNEAARLLELGADVDDLVASCGLSRPEAELVAALHRQRSAA